MAAGAAPSLARSRLYLAAAVGVMLLAFVGFYSSYYLRPLFSTRPLAPLVHLHGALMTAWIALFVAQAVLVLKRNLALHRGIGIVGGVLAGGIVWVGSSTVAAAIARRFPGAGFMRSARIFLEFDGLSLWVFGALVLLAILWRSRPDVHKRLMLSASVALLPPAVGRIAEHLMRGNDANLAIAAAATCVFILACAVADTLRLGRVHPAMAWGTAAVIGANVATQLAQVGD